MKRSAAASGTSFGTAPIRSVLESRLGRCTAPRPAICDRSGALEIDEILQAARGRIQRDLASFVVVALLSAAAALTPRSPCPLIL